ncbi:alpha/beta fold hydrolase [Streptomyces atroolivaceus]|uniref:alpha/beta fold hydrolase n=1 Tax=Streptomyces atroolivaceus TaxID=66869 RepID=UPI003419757C
MITYDNRGVGASGGSAPATIGAMARDTVLFIRALGFDQVDLLGLSMGGFIAQVIAAEEPDLVRKLILAGTGPAGGPGIDKVTSVTVQDTLKATLRRKDPKHYLFFTRPRVTTGRDQDRHVLHIVHKATGLLLTPTPIPMTTAPQVTWPGRVVRPDGSSSFSRTANRPARDSRSCGCRVR